LNGAFPCHAQWRSPLVISLTVAGAAPALQCDRTPRTGFPFHPSGNAPSGHLNRATLPPA
jgi:hypothetical protein